MSEERCYPRLSEWMTTYTYHENHLCVVEKVYYFKGPTEKDPADLIVYKNPNGHYASVSRRFADANWVKHEKVWEKDKTYWREGWKAVVVKHVFDDGTAAWEEFERTSCHGVHTPRERQYWREVK